MKIKKPEEQISPYRLWYKKPAPDRGMTANSKWGGVKDEDWESWSLPLGCGYMGVSVFGKTDHERLQVTENSLCNPYPWGVNNFAELSITTGHEEDDCSGYERDLVLDEAIGHVSYTYEGIEYKREYLTSYPDKVLAVHLTASEPGMVSFCFGAQIPYLRPFCEKGGFDGESHYREQKPFGKEGRVYTEDNELVLTGQMEYYGIQFEGRFTIKTTGGTVTAGNSCLNVTGADEAVILGAIGTNYQMKPSVFLEPDHEKKLAGFEHPHRKVAAILKNAAERSWSELKERHVEDFSQYFGRVSLVLGEASPEEELPTDERLTRYQSGKADSGLEALYFQYGRYLLISSSRKGTLPGNLQGIWNQYEWAPWSAGYWHNINIQMNYWPVFSCNLAEMFDSYKDYNLAFRELAKQLADHYVKTMRAENPDVEYAEECGEAGQNGWTVGTGAWPYSIEGPNPSGHSGPGTGGLTAKLFWDCYDFTRDKKELEETLYPTLEGMSRFLSKSVIKNGEEYLACPSASPEQCIDGIYPNYYHTKGCMFDQQMIYECYRDTKNAAKVLGIHSDVTEVIEKQIDHLTPVLIGKSGQLKEYREEEYYGDIGEKHHRHLSHLVGLMPGQLIHKGTPEWLKAAACSLTLRGDESTGWAMAHRLNAWARVGDGEHAHRILRNLLTKGTLPNLWDTHPPFQIDGNYGGTAGIAEMLLQSHGGFIELLPALPAEWKTGSFKGLVARGNVVVDAVWENGILMETALTARAGGIFEIHYSGIGDDKRYVWTTEMQMESDPVKCLETEKDRIVWRLEKGSRIVCRWNCHAKHDARLAARTPRCS